MQTCHNNYIIDISYTSYWCVDTCAWPWSFFAICDIACCAYMHFFLNRVRVHFTHCLRLCVFIVQEKKFPWLAYSQQEYVHETITHDVQHLDDCFTLPDLLDADRDLFLTVQSNRHSGAVSREVKVQLKQSSTAKVWWAASVSLLFKSLSTRCIFVWSPLKQTIYQFTQVFFFFQLCTTWL